MVNIPVQEIRRRFGASVRPDYTTNVRQQEVIRKVVEYFGLEYVKEHVGQLTRLHAVMGTANTFHQFGKLKINFIHNDCLVTRETDIPPLQIQTQLCSYLDGYDAYFMKRGNEYTVRNPAAKSQLQDTEQAWHNFITGPWRHFLGFRWYALPLRPPPLPLACLLLLVHLLLLLFARLLLLARRLFHSLLLPLMLLHLLVPVYPDFAYPTPTPTRRLTPFPNLPTPAATPARAPTHPRTRGPPAARAATPTRARVSGLRAPNPCPLSPSRTFPKPSHPSSQLPCAFDGSRCDRSHSY
ncbi:hypothetical protein B0H14DRAFT_3453985 [Mycena olivaceomarginata]|nr:hypothetical protein B0H14DRAFT_3453985 [Mycena olivaceomarginata]